LIAYGIFRCLQIWLSFNTPPPGGPLLVLTCGFGNFWFVFMEISERPLPPLFFFFLFPLYFQRQFAGPFRLLKHKRFPSPSFCGAFLLGLWRPSCGFLYCRPPVFFAGNGPWRLREHFSNGITPLHGRVLEGVLYPFLVPKLSQRGNFSRIFRHACFAFDLFRRQAFPTAPWWRDLDAYGVNHR